MKNSYPRSNSFLDFTSFIKYSILIFLTGIFTINIASAQCGPGTAVQAPGALTATDPSWATVTKDTIGSIPANTVTNNSTHTPFPAFSSDGFPLLASPTSREADFGTPTWQAQWTTTDLYILVTVPDLSVNFDPVPNDTFFYNYDAVEVYLSGNNAHAGPPYGNDDVQYGFSNNGVFRGTGGNTTSSTTTTGVTGTATITPGVGYTMFITIPLSSFVAPSAMNSQVSFDIAIDDNDHTPDIAAKMAIDSAALVAGGETPAAAHAGVIGFESGGDYRDAQTAWNSTTGQAPYSTTSDLGNLVLTAPPKTATAGVESICGSGIITLSGNTPSLGETAQWTVGGGMASLAQLTGGINNPLATFHSAGLGTYIFTWSIFNNACSAIPSTANDTISVTPLPLLLITNPAAVCSPATVDITAPAVTAGSSGGTTLTYFTDPSTMIPLPTPTAVATSGTYYIQSTSTNNCITVTPVTVTINISPVITVTESDPTACASSTGSFTVNGLIPGTIYTINFDAGGVAQTPQTLTATAAGTVTVTGLPQGSYTNIIAVPPAGCVSNAGSATLTDPAAPTPIASTGGTVCAGGTLTLASTLTGGATYTWTGPGGYTASGATQTISPATSADSGLYTVTVTSVGCVGTSSIVGVVNPTPVLVITNPAAICAPSGIDITVPAVTAGSTLPPGTVLSYYTNAGGTIVLATPTNITTSGTYYIKAVSGLGCSIIAPVTVIINPQPAIAVTSTNPTACATSTGSFTVTGLTPGATYIINFDAGGVAQAPQTLIANGAGTVTVTTLPAGSYTNITATSAAGCTSNTATATLNDPAAPTPTASTGGTICTGGSLTLASTLTGGATYTWTGPGGYTASGATQTISPATSADSGLYTVTVTLAGCIGTSSVVAVVNPTPVLVITNPAAICAPSGIDITVPAVTAGSTLPPGTVLSYYTNAGGTIVLGAPTNIITSGTYYIKAVSGLGCSVIAPVTVAINPQPAIAVTSTNPTACATSTGSFTVTGLTPGATYIINFDAGGVAQAPQTLIANGAGTVTVTTLPAGSYTNITATSAAGCTSNTATATLNDPAAPTPTASTGGTICTGGSLTLASTLTGGATYTWTGPGGYTASGATQTISPATSADSGLYTVTVTLAGCIGTSSVVAVVNPTPVLVITNPAAICAPSGIDITVPAVTAGSTLPPGTVLSYYTNAGGTIVLGAPTNITTSGTYYIKAVSGLGCSVIAPVTVTINPQPAIVVTSTNPTTCATSTGSFTVTGLTPGATYIINFDAGGVAQAPQTLIANGAGTVTVTTLPAGSYTNITATSAAGCTSNAATATLNDPAAPTPTAGTLGAVCSGNTLSLTSTPTAGASYSWSGPNGFSSTLQNPTVPLALYADSGSYTVTVTLAGCIGTSTITGIVHPTPVLTITDPAAICAPAGVDITASAVTAGSTLPSDAVLSYYTNAGGTIVLATPTNITTSGTYYIKALTGSGCSDIKPVTVTVNPQPAIVITSTNPTACATSTGSFTVGGLTTGATYTINFDEGGVAQAPQILIANAAGAVIVATLPAGSYTAITATSVAGCVSNVGTATLSDPAAPTPTAGTGGPICSGNTLSLTSTPTAGATYSWSGPNAFSSTLQSPSIPLALYADSGMYTVTVTLTGCTGTSSVDGVVNQTPVLTITNPTVICSFVSIDITAPAITVGSTLPSSTVLSYYTDAAATIPLATPTNVTASGTYYIKALTGSGCSDIAPVLVTISPLPPITITETDPTACATNTGTFTINGLTAGVIYTINFDKGGVAQVPQVFTASAAGTIIISGLSAGSYTAITATVAAGCVSNMGSTTLSDPAAPTPIAGTLGAVCSGNTLSLTSTPTAGATYSWSGPNGFSSTLQNPTIPLALYADSGLYNLTVTLTGCTGNSSIVGVVHPTPILTITNPAAICASGTIDITVPAITAGSTLPDAVLSYYTDAAATITLATPANITTSGTYYIKALTGSGCSDVEPVVITINPLPVLTITDPAAVCFPATIDITAPAVTAGSTGGTTLSYYINAAATITLATPTAISTSGIYYIKSITASGCSVIAPVTVTINPLPVLTITDPTAVCAPTTVDITAPAITTGSTGGTTLSYYTDAAATITLPAPTVVAASGIYYIKSMTASGCSVIAPVTVTINPLPVLTITDPAAVCSPATVDITVPAVTAGSTGGTTLSYYTDAAATIILTTPTVVTTSGTYYIKSVTASGCSVIMPVTVTINPLPILTITNPPAACSPSTVDITAAAVTAGSTGGNTLTYYTDAAATAVLATPAAVSASGIYYIKSTTASGCSVVQPVAVTINPTPVLVITNPAAVCSPSTVDVTAGAVTAGSTLLGGSLSYYTDAAATTPLAIPTAVAASGTYYIKATTASGCSAVHAVTVTINPTPVLVITNPAAICSPSTVDVTAAAVTAGSTLPAGTTLSYYTDAAATITLASPTAVAASGTYYIKAITVSGCTDIKPVTVTINTSPVLVIQNPDAQCSPATEDITNPAIALNNSTLPVGTTVNYYSDAAATVVLTNPESTDSGTYYIKAMTPFGCSAIAPIPVNIYTSPLPPIVVPLQYCQGADNIPALTAGADTLLWYTTSIGGTGSSSAPVPSTVNGDVTLPFFVTQTQAHAGVPKGYCESTTRAELDVRITTTPKVTVNPSLIQEYAGVPVTLDGQATGDSTTRTVTWNTIEGISGYAAFAFTEITTVTPPSAIVPVDSTRYYFIATSIEDGECADTASVLVNVLQPLLIPNIFSPNGDGINDIWDIKYIQEFDNAEVSIFNRYGQFIYKSNDGYRTPWDGTYHGDPVPVGSYFYIIKTTPDAKPISGYVAVVR